KSWNEGKCVFENEVTGKRQEPFIGYGKSNDAEYEERENSCISVMDDPLKSRFSHWAEEAEARSRKPEFSIALFCLLASGSWLLTSLPFFFPRDSACMTPECSEIRGLHRFFRFRFGLLGCAPFHHCNQAQRRQWHVGIDHTKQRCQPIERTDLE